MVKIQTCDKGYQVSFDPDEIEKYIHEIELYLKTAEETRRLYYPLSFDRLMKLAIDRIELYELQEIFIHPSSKVEDFEDLKDEGQVKRVVFIFSENKNTNIQIKKEEIVKNISSDGSHFRENCEKYEAESVLLGAFLNLEFIDDY